MEGTLGIEADLVASRQVPECSGEHCIAWRRKAKSGGKPQYAKAATRNVHTFMATSTGSSRHFIEGK